MRDLEAIALLEDPARRALYAYVAQQGREVSRNEAAEAVGLSRTLAAFHLDRLAAAGLLEITYKRLTSRSGPGAGRPAKLYRRANAEHTYSAPPREYELAARVFAEAIERSGAESTLYDVARKQGMAVGRALVRGPGSATFQQTQRGPQVAYGAVVALGQLEGLELAEQSDKLVEHLDARGYVPYTENGTLRLRNCPFQVVANEAPAVTCGMNLALIEGLLAGARLETAYAAELDPRGGDCCVAIRSKTNQD